jgi:hypothetical protein
VLEFVWRYKKLETKCNVKHIDLVRRGITQTNTNVFNIGKHHEHETCANYTQVDQRQGRREVLSIFKQNLKRFGIFLCFTASRTLIDR